MAKPRNFTCGFCGTLVPLPNELGATMESDYPTDTEVKWYSLECASCSRFTVAAVGRRRISYYPPEGMARIKVDGVPESIVADYHEALACLQVNAFKAASAMARRAVQGVCLDLGANPKHRLFAQIDALNEKGEFTNRLRRLAHKVRLFGNNGAHPGEDGLDDVVPEDARQAVAFVEHVLQHVYILGGDDDEDAADAV